MRRPRDQDVDVEPVELDHRLLIGVHALREPVHVVPVDPVGDEFPRVVERYALRPVVDGLGLLPSRPEQSLPQVVDLLRGDLDAERDHPRDATRRAGTA